ncbi:MAG: anthranilate phosphoribosyltransferase [Hyphomonadaceae bacterium]|nr:anthranilate phosphoribosyltransferase [Hyphomonadaceae bacterium]
MDGQASEAEIRSFLTRTVQQMTDPEALAAGARALRSRMIAMAAPEGAIDVCGTGGDGAHTLNISTAVAFVVAGCGVPVAKHGNRAMSSKSGAADVLEALGVKLTGDGPTLEQCLREAGIAFLFAQNHHPAMRHVAAARRELGHRTIFNLLGPLSNPARVKRQLVGVFSPEAVTPMAKALALLNAERAWVVHGAGGLDELSCQGPCMAAETVCGEVIRQFGILSADAGIGAFDNAAVRGGDAAHNAAQLSDLLAGRLEGAAYENFVLLNAGAALLVAGRGARLADGVVLARGALREGRALEALDKLRALTGSAP